MNEPDTGEHAVEVRTRAVPAFLSSVRAVAADLALRQDMDLDSVADLRLAVDEACSSLVRLAREDSTLVCGFTVEPGALRVSVSVRSASSSGPPRDDFGWQVLSTLTDELDCTVHQVNGTGDYLVRLELRKRVLA